MCGVKIKMNEIKRLTFSLKKDLYMEIRVQAAKENLTMSEWICKCIEKNMNKTRRK